MKQQLAIVIAALMIASIASTIPTTVSATHDQTPTIDETTVKGDTPMVLTITVANAGPDAIENVRITVPSAFLEFAPTMKLFKDNEVNLTVDNTITLPAGTLIKVTTTGGVVEIPENTVVIIENGTEIYWKPTGASYFYAALIDNLRAKITNTEYDNQGNPKEEGALGNLTFDLTGENVNVAEEFVGTVPFETTFKLLADTQVVWVGEGVFRLPENLLVQLVDPGITFAHTSGEKITLESDKEVTSAPPFNFAGNSIGRAFAATSTARTNTVYNILAGENVFVKTNKIIVPTSAELILTGSPTVTLFENTEVIREEGTTVTLAEGSVSENQPKDWTHKIIDPTTVEWKGIGENQIAPGKNLPFPFAVTTPDISGTYTILVRTKDTDNDVTIKEVTITVDATHPTIKEIDVSPEWAKASTKVTITVTASEPLAKLDNVMVAENENTENVQVAMSPNADKTVWTGTYTTTDNENRDGPAMVWVIGEQLEDMLGNECENIENAMFYVDKLKPPTPDLTAIKGLPTTPTTNDATWFIEGKAGDNYIGSSVNPKGMTVKIRVGTTVYPVTSGEGGYFYKSITLAEGIQEIGIRYIDLAGNVGDENAENITLDTKAPSIEWGKIAGEALVDGIHINDNVPTITLTISDAGLGVDNEDFNATDNTGYSVQLLDADKENIENLVNALKHDNHVLAFENTLSEWADNTYYIYAVAGDNWQMDNELIKFVIDTHAPDAPSVDVAYKIDSTMNTPLVVKDASRTIAGTAEAGAEITVYGAVDTTEKVLTTATAGSDKKWTATFTLTAGQNTKIELSATDEAGNEGSRESYGWMLADASAPSVTLAEVPDTTDKTSITISGTVSKDDWEDWSEITLTVQVGTGKVEVPCVGGSYEYSLSLAEGPNTIVVQATDDIGNVSTAAHDVVERTVTPWATYAIILVIIALVLAAIAIFRKR